MNAPGDHFNPETIHPINPEDAKTLLTTLTTEHFTLQGARASTTSESTARAALYVGALSSSLIAIGFISETDHFGMSFRIFTMIILPTLYVLGLLTFVRLVQSSVEDLWYGRAINRIREFYREMAGENAYWFALGGHDDSLGVLANMGLPHPSRWQSFFTMAAMVSFLNAVVGGSTAAFLVSSLGGSLLLAGVIGIGAGFLSVYLYYRWQNNLYRQARKLNQPLFPTRKPRTASK